MLDFIQNADYWIFNQINGVLTNSSLDIFFFWITDLHKTIYFKIIVIPLIAFLFIKKFRRQGFILFLMLLLSLGINDFIGGKVKKLVARERPEYNINIQIIKRSDAGNYSFYSNHAANMFTFATYTSQFFPQIKIPFYAVASLVAYSRVYNGVHYPSDIFTGGLVGYMWGLFFSNLAQKLLNYLNTRIKKRKNKK